MQDLGTFIAENLALIIACITGISLLVVEVFMPGFGVAGIGGALLMAGSIVMVWNQYGSAAGLWMTLGALLLAGTAITVSLRNAKRGQGFRKLWGLKDVPLVLEESDVASLVGRKGVAQTDLRPSGIANFDEVIKKFKLIVPVSQPRPWMKTCFVEHKGIGIEFISK